MNKTELQEIIKCGEDSTSQFKANITNVLSAAQEIVAFSNCLGGNLIIGVDDKGNISGLNRDDINRLSNLVSNAASQLVKPPVNPITQNFSFPQGLVMVVTVHQGATKPYMDKNGSIWIKSGSDKRKATSREEIQRMFQESGLIHGDELPTPNMTIEDINFRVFQDFYEKQYDEKFSLQDLDLEQLFTNLNLYKKGNLNISGALLFGENLGHKLPLCTVKCVVYSGDDIHESSYAESLDISGCIKDTFDDLIKFFSRNLKHVQKNQGVNSTGQLEIPKIALEELIVNALIHRDYLVSSTIRIFIFKNRVEIISPGHLPNNLSIENIKSGNSNIRNPILASFAAKILPYRGLGNGIRRALKVYPDIEFKDDRKGNQFKVIISRKYN